MGPQGQVQNCVYTRVCVQWISSSKSDSCYYLLCMKHLWEPQQKWSYQQFHTKDQLAELRFQKPLSWMQTNVCAQSHISAKHKLTHTHRCMRMHTCNRRARKGLQYFLPQPD